MSRAKPLVAAPAAREAVIARARGPRSRADLVRVAPCAGEMLRPGGALGTAASDTSRAIEDDAEEDSRERDDVRRRTFFATNCVGALAACASACADAVNAAEEVPKDYAKLARELVVLLAHALLRVAQVHAARAAQPQRLLVQADLPELGLVAQVLLQVLRDGQAASQRRRRRGAAYAD